MNRLMNIIITLLFGFALMLPINTMGANTTHYDDNGLHHGDFKIADLYLDGESEIVLLEDDTLIIMDNQGQILFKKTVEGIEDHHDDDNDDDDDCHHMGNSDKTTFNVKYNRWGDWDEHDHHNGGVGLDVANLDNDQYPEIIILDSENLIVLDNEGDLKYTIALP